MKNYEKVLDEIFADGRLWKHRTFRTVLDPSSQEYSKTTIDEKIDLLKVLVDNGIGLDLIIDEYKVRYLEQNRRDIAVNTEFALIIILEHLLKKQPIK
jgi:hypothetical protein